MNKLIIYFSYNSEKYFLKRKPISELQISAIPDDIYLQEINKFGDSFKIKNKNLQRFWIIILRCLCGFLIKKSYKNTLKKQNENFSNNQITEDQDKINLKDNEYIILREIGKGNSAYVNLIYIIKEEELFALKIPYDKESELIERERKNYLMFKYPFIVHYYGYIESYDKKCLLLDYVFGETLRKYDLTKLNRIEKYCIIFELMLTIQYIHSQCFILRDLSLNNIMINENKDVILIDLDRLIEQDEQTTMNINIPYFPPEFLSNGYFTYESDIYLLGHLVYYILHENFPKKRIVFESDSPEESLFKFTIELNPDDRPTINELAIDFYLKAILTNSIQKNKMDKLSSLFESNIDLLDENDIYLFDEKINQSESYNNKKLGDNYYYGRKDVQIDIKKAIHYYSLSADQNNSDAQCALGLIYYEGKYIQRDIKKAIHYFKLSADQNNSMAQFNLGVIYCKEESISKDINKSIYYYSLAASQNNLYAQINLGNLYYAGNYISFDIKKAIYYYSLAAKQNNSYAQYNLGAIFYNGNYVQRDIKKAIYYFSLASNQNVSDAQFKLGNIYFEGKFIPRDIKKAIHYFSLASNQNNLEAQFYLGSIYFEGIGVPIDISKSIEYYSLAAKQGHPNAQYNLGMIYYMGKDIQRDINKAIYYFTLSAKNNVSYAQNKLGFIYMNGIGVPHDIDKGIYYYKLAAKQNNAAANYNLGIIYLDGKHLPCDNEKAFHYISLAAKQNDAYAQNQLGYFYLVGKIVQQDIKKAIHYYTISAANNYVSAQLNLGQIYYEGKYVPQDIHKSIRYFLLAANQNNSRAQFQLGLIYYENNSISPDINKAIHFLTLSANNNCSDAQYLLGSIYFEGLYVDFNIQKATRYFKEASCFYNQYAKNNLGVIYKNGQGVEANIEISIIFFEEAIRQSENEVSMFNLAHIYFYKEAGIFDLDKSIELLIKSTKKLAIFAIHLLSLAVIKKYKNLKISEIIKDFEKIDKETGESITCKVIQNIKSLELYDTILYGILFEILKDINLVYYGRKIKNQTQNEKIKVIDKKSIINTKFYEGLGEI